MVLTHLGKALKNQAEPAGDPKKERRDLLREAVRAMRAAKDDDEAVAAFEAAVIAMRED